MALVVVLGGFVGATLVRMAPGFGVDEEELDSRLNDASRSALRRSKEGLAVFYARYGKQLLHGDLGMSIAFHEPVRDLLAERIPETAKTIGVGLAVGWTCGLGLAIACGIVRNRWMEWSATLAATLFLCIPAAVLALLFVLAEAPGRLAAGLIVFPKIFQFTRNLLARSAALPHTVTARAKGLNEWQVMARHVLPVAAPQLLALGGVSVCMVLGACIPVEVLCDLPGIGQLAWKAALSRDLPLLVNLTMLVTLITLAANLAVDVAGGTAQERNA